MTCQHIRAALLAWYESAARDLPWRGAGRTPWRTLVSEAMLQQTQVKTVLPYFARFVERFPTVESLAAADEEDVLRLWQGLGYYSRATESTEGGESDRRTARRRGAADRGTTVEPPRRRPVHGRGGRQHCL